ncbi:MAG TPA: hypothetical protein VLI69_06540 [Gammaproteobacteria bacterium]|nr:hypothetical protein [Gammaproteobacteria bacterium]
MQLNAKKLSNFLAPLIFIFCFIVIVFSINQIINMAKPKLVGSAQQDNESLYFAPVNTAIQSSSPIDYKQLKATLSVIDQSILQTRFKINPQIEKLSVNEQDYIIRLKLLEWKIDKLQNQITQLSSSQPESLIFKLGFWIYSLFIWTGSIVGGQILRFHTDRLIQKKWG